MEFDMPDKPLSPDDSGLRPLRSILATHDAEIKFIKEGMATLRMESRENAQEIKSSVNSLSNKLSSIQDDVGNRVSTATKTDWSKIIGTITVSFAVLGYMFSAKFDTFKAFGEQTQAAVVRLDAAVQTFATKYHDEQIAQAEIRGASKKDIENLHEKMAVITKATEDLDRRLQMEMRLVNDVTDKKVTALDTHSQERFETNQRQVKSLEGKTIWLLEHVSRIMERLKIETNESIPNGKD